ncbi:MipA/OmpV family protein [Arenimonas fontis]|uniref:MipA/OmpV family protein n=1 Tax=Arenimonas fontis TaxID=2608255 RepID=A0A5B2Z4X1_9GAMM|nr:MipA/OmpV family protein [Arenimonas fontis]KAA2283968.1 MipA/OmpV family protein [Arenimonas fontis]
MRSIALGCLIAAIALAAPPVAAQDGGRGEDRKGPPRWTFGGLLIDRADPYADIDRDPLLVPLVRFEGERAYLRGLRAGWRFVDRDDFELAGLAQARLNGYEAKDSPALAGMARRRSSLDLGLAATWRTPLGGIELALLQDALDRSGGREASLTWGLPFRRGGWGFLPALALRWQDADLVDYYYGVRPGEALPDRPAYEGDTALVAELSLLVERRLGPRWSLFARIGHSRYPGEIADSPIVERDHASSVMIGLGWSPAD